MPLLMPALVAAWLMLFVIFIRELGATILLYAQGTETISVALVILSDAASATSRRSRSSSSCCCSALRLFQLTRASLVQS